SNIASEFAYVLSEIEFNWTLDEGLAARKPQGTLGLAHMNWSAQPGADQSSKATEDKIQNSGSNEKNILGIKVNTTNYDKNNM
ncbi:hypothetical protein ACJX0J_028551, partial [Zea mays]